MLQVVVVVQVGVQAMALVQPVQLVEPVQFIQYEPHAWHVLDSVSKKVPELHVQPRGAMLIPTRQVVQISA